MGGLNAPMEAGRDAREELLLKSTEGGAYYFCITYKNGHLEVQVAKAHFENGWKTISLRH